MSETFELSSPITTHRGPVTTLTLNQPKARSFIRHGVPFKHIVKGEGDNQEVATEFDPKAMFGFLSDMTDHDQITLEDIPACDVMGLFWKMVTVISNPQMPKTS